MHLIPSSQCICQVICLISNIFGAFLQVLHGIFQMFFQRCGRLGLRLFVLIERLLHLLQVLAQGPRDVLEGLFRFLSKLFLSCLQHRLGLRSHLRLDGFHLLCQCLLMTFLDFGKH